jgi:type II secretory pathway pseudopilin PulG
MSARIACRRGQGGFVLIGVLVALSLAALVAVQSGQRLADMRQRASEAELLSIGDQYRQAIESYWRLSPGGVRTLPVRLEDLVLDPRFPQPRRHIRKLYSDPMDLDSTWGVLRVGGAVVGVYSQAEGVPFKQNGFADGQIGFDNAQSYSSWHFNARVPTVQRPPSAAPIQGATR